MVTAQPTPEYAIVPGNCLEIMRTLGDSSVDAIVTDPPYGLSNTDPAHAIDALTHWLAEIAARPTPETAQEEESIPA